MYSEREASIVRFFADNNTVVGAGFLVSSHTVLTCAHVVTAALRIAPNQETSDAPASPLCLDFPIIAPNCTLSARVDAQYWQPPRPDGSGDIAILHLDADVPEGARAARLIQSDEDLWGHDFRVFGYPDKHPDGVWASGELRGRRTAGWIQIEDVKVPGYRVQRGFSGGAIWDDQLGGVVGMAVAADTEAANKVAYMIPTSVLVSACPQLGKMAIPACPYRGLSAFREQDEPYFFGRNTFTQQLVDDVARKPLVAVIGSSGSGKSSVVFAGLNPRLRSRGNWLFAAFRPGNRPFYSLSAALVPLLEPQMSETDRLVEVNKQARYMQEGELLLQDIVETTMKKSPGMHLLLIADQFEELYTLCKEPEVRLRFLDELLAALSAPFNQDSISFNLVLTLRADFVGQALSYRPFADALQYADLKLGPMNVQELQDVIVEPARKLHVNIEDGLTGHILKEVSSEPGHLPLLEFALTLLWAKQKDSKLTHSAYSEIGGVEKALADHAEEVYNALTEQQQQQAQRILVQLVRPGEGTEDTRRLATRSDVGEYNWELVMRLTSARLIVTGRDTTTGEETVEVIHEALISGWQRLRDWIEENREFRTWQERLRAALRQWESKGKDSGALLRGALLVEASEWLKQHSEAISAQERVFIEASQQQKMEEAQYLRGLLEQAERGRQEAERQRLIAEHQSQEAERQRKEAEHQQRIAEQQRREAEYQREKARRQQQIAERRQREAEEQRQEVERQRQVTLARGLASQAVLYSQYEHDLHLIECSILLAIESLRRYPSLEADQSLREGGALLRRRLGILGHESAVRAVVFNPDGRLLATASDDGTAGIWEVSSGKRIVTLEHKDWVTAIAFSPDKKLIATASDDKTAGIWEVSSGKRMEVLGHENGVRAVVFSPDGRLIATASGDKTAGIWEVSGGKQVVTLRHKDWMRAVVFSPDGKLIATASRDGTVGVWKVSGGKQVATLRHKDGVRAVAFSPDGKLIATASDDKTAGVWEVSSGKRIVTLEHKDSVRAVMFSPDGKLIATASRDRTARVWEVNSGKRVAMLRHESQVTAIVFNSDGKVIATASVGGTAGMWEVSSGKRVAMLGHKDWVTAIAFSPDGKLVATASRDKTAGIWEISGGKQVAMLGHENEVAAISFSSDGKLVATTSDDKIAGEWKVSSGKRVATQRHKNWVRAVAFSPDGKLVAMAGGGATAGIWEVSSDKQIATLAHESEVTAIAFSPDGKLIATASDDSTAGIWEVIGWKRVKTLRHFSRVTAIAFSPGGKLIATASDDKTAGVWEVSSGKRIATVRHWSRVTVVVFGPDGKLIATASDDKTAGVWEVSGGKRVAFLKHEGSVWAVAFSSDGKLVATASRDKTAGVWEVSSGKPVMMLGHESPVGAVAFNPDGKLVATASDDKTARIWEIYSGQQLVRLVHKNRVSDVAFSLDGNYLATASSNVTQIWLWRPEDLIAAVKPKLTRNLTPEEWKQFLGNEPYCKTFEDLP